MSQLVRREEPVVPVSYADPGAPWFDLYFQQREGTVRRYFQLVMKRKWSVLAVLVVSLVTAEVVNTKTTPLYRSTAKIQIEPDANILPYKDLYESTSASSKYMETQAEVLKSRTLAARVVQRLNHSPVTRSGKATVGEFLSHLEVAPVVDTQVMRVAITADRPEFAAQAVNLLAEEYMDYSFENKYDATIQAKQFLEKEMLNLKEKLERSEQELVAYARQNNIPVMGSGDNVVLQRVTDLNQQITRVEGQLLSNQYEMIKGSSPEEFPESLKTAAMKDVEGRLISLNSRLTLLSAQFGSKWPEVQAVKEEIANLRQQLVKETDRAVQQAKIEYTLAQQHRARLSSALDAQSRQVNQLSQDSIQYGILKREVDTDRQLYEGMLQRLKEAGVAAGLKSNNVRVVDRGEVPRTPYSPNRPRNFALALTLGLVLGMAWAVGLDSLDRSLRTSEQVNQMLGIPFLGSIPLAKLAGKWNSGLLGLSQSEGLVRCTDSWSQSSWESYRSLRTSLLLSSAERRPRVILVTSALSGEGKTTTCINLGICLAQTGARTLVLEADLRRPRLTEMMKLSGTKGISHYLSGNSDLSSRIRESGIPNLFVIPAGVVPPNPPELIGSPRMGEAIELLSQHFKYIVIDSPPVLSVTDALLISPHVDGAVLVVRSGKTPRDVVLKAKDHLEQVGTKLLGALLNGGSPRYTAYSQYGGDDKAFWSAS